jgi:hypothetical protein
MAAMTIEACTPLPPSCGVAFKEWEGVCRALLGGRQSLILRKGGIDEGPGGFRPEHPAFWLYPTRVHQAQQGLKPEALADPDPTPHADQVELRGLVVVERVFQVDDPERLPRLDGRHVWTAETVEKRFHYRRPGLWVLGVRVYARAEPWVVAVTSDHAGCKTWVPLGEGLSTAGLRPVLDDGDFRCEMGLIDVALGAGDGD